MPGCLVLVCSVVILTSLCPRCLRAWVLGAGHVCVLASLCPRCLRAWVLGAGIMIGSSGHFVPEVPSCLGAWCW